MRDGAGAIYTSDFCLLSPRIFLVVNMSKKRVCVVVLGDIGRSPRMQYHSLSLIDKGYEVDIVGYKESELLPQLEQSPSCHVCTLSSVPTIFSLLPRSLSLVFKVIWQSIDLFVKLPGYQKPQIVLVQNPPSVPTLPVVWFYCRINGIKWMVDWHNYGFSILALNSSSFLVKIYKWMETKYGSKADFHLCVTQAFANDLSSKYGIEATVFYDQPSNIFKSLTLDEKRDLFVDLAFFKGMEEFEDFVDISNGSKSLKSDRPVLLLSSTSWTEDEDFSLLLEALEKFDEIESTPRMLCVITGKGPLKEFYKNVIQEKQLEKVRIILPWLEPEDYPLVVASADLGVCLHTSSSGLDLPMKVVDMFGTYLPVCAYHYETLNELVQDDVNGLHFKNSEQLSHQLTELLKEHPKPAEKLLSYRKQLEKKYGGNRWDKSWDEIVSPLFQNH